MIPVQIKGRNGRITPPIDWDQSDGVCHTLYIRIAENDAGVPMLQSAWLPTAEELAALNAGAPVVLTTLGKSFPPTSLEVVPGEIEASEKMT